MEQREGGQAPGLTIADLWTMRSDYEDVEVPEMGGSTLRVYALSGLARARLIPAMAELASRPERDDSSVESVAAVFAFQGRAVAASLGLPEADWDAAQGALPSAVVVRLYDVVERLSGLGAQAQDEAVQRLPGRRKAASGTA